MATSGDQISTAGTVVDDWTRQKITDLSTSNKEVMELLRKKFNHEDFSSNDQILLQDLMSQRQQTTSLLSNMLRAMFESMSNVIRNIRA